MRTRTVSTILLVEDDETDSLHFQRLARKLGVADKISVVDNGERALEFLRAADSKDGVADAVVVTDLNMPGLTGHELIEDIRADPRICNTVIFVLSTSDLRSDIARAYGNRIAGYIVKGPSAGGMLESVKLIGQFQATVSL